MEEKERCLCALAAVAAFKNFEELGNELNVRRPDKYMVVETLESLKNNIDRAERYCGVDLREQKEQIEEASSMATKFGDWDTVSDLTGSAFRETLDKLYKCAGGEPLKKGD
jgi:hypothetical protein